MDCPHLPEIAYSDFSRRLHDVGVEAGLPLVGGVELTRRCNLRCAHCYVNAPLSETSGELDAEALENLLAQIAEAGCLWLLLTGGEPLVRTDFPRLYAFAKNKGFLVTLFTNATLVTPDHAKLFRDMKPFKVEVTLYGATADTYERVTRVKGSFRKCIEGVERLASTGAPLCLKTVALSLNRHEAGAIEAMARRYGATFRFDPMIMGRVDGKEGPRRVRLSAQQVFEMDVSHADRVREWFKVRHRFSGIPVEGHLVFQCGAGVNAFFVDAEGGLVLCPVARTWRYDLLEGTFREGWERAKRARKEKRRTRPSPCATCHLAAFCGQCPGWGETEHGDPEARVEYLCRIAHLRAEYLKKLKA